MNYGDALPPGFQFVPFWAKGEFKRNPFAALTLRPGAVVMDCGAHVGMFAAAAPEQGASHVTCYEPEPRNASRLRENLSRYGPLAEVVETALTVRGSMVALDINGIDGAHQLSGVREKLGKEPPRRVARLTPEVVKIDVEGAEYDLLDSLECGDLAAVESLFIEFHPVTERDRRKTKIVSFLVAEGFTVVQGLLRAFIVSRRPDRRSGLHIHRDRRPPGLYPGPRSLIHFVLASDPRAARRHPEVRSPWSEPGLGARSLGGRAVVRGARGCLGPPPGGSFSATSAPVVPTATRRAVSPGPAVGSPG